MHRDYAPACCHNREYGKVCRHTMQEAYAVILKTAPYLRVFIIYVPFEFHNVLSWQKYCPYFHVTVHWPIVFVKCGSPSLVASSRKILFSGDRAKALELIENSPWPAWSLGENIGDMR